MAMAYEAYLDEVTTLITEMVDVIEEAAIKQVVRAQAAALKQPKPSQQPRQPKQARTNTRKK
jgi:hypothetical protein